MNEIFYSHVSGLFSELCISQEYVQNFKRTWENSVCISVNSFAKSVNF